MSAEKITIVRAPGPTGVKVDWALREWPLEAVFSSKAEVGAELTIFCQNGAATYQVVERDPVAGTVRMMLKRGIFSPPPDQVMRDGRAEALRPFGAMPPALPNIAPRREADGEFQPVCHGREK